MLKALLESLCLKLARLALRVSVWLTDLSEKLST
jgi:hypothetical protein